MLDTIPLFVKGLIVGLLVAAPMGPVNVLCIQRTLLKGRLDGFLTGAGAAVGDTLFAIVAAFGLTAVADFIERNEQWFRMPGGLFLLAMSVFIWRAHPHIMRAETGPPPLGRTVFATFFLTITNPITLAAFAALFVAWELHTGAGEYFATARVVGGVLAGSLGWWLILVTLTGLLHGRIEDRHLSMFNHIAAVAIFCFGIYAIISTLPYFRI